MTTQTLDQFFAVFGTAPVNAELSQFDSELKFLKKFLTTASEDDLDKLDKKLGKSFAEVMKRVAREGGFYLLPLPSADRDFFEASVVGVDGKRNLVNLRARLVAQCWCFEDASMVGNPKAVGSFRADVLGQLFDRVRHLNGMDSDDVEEAGKD